MINSNELRGVRVAVLLSSGFDMNGFADTFDHLLENGAEVDLVSSENFEVCSARTGAGTIETFPVDMHIENARVEDFDALFLPDGFNNSASLRTSAAALQFIREFVEADKLVATIGHGIQPLIDAQVIAGRRITACPSIKSDLINAGAIWTDSQVVEDGRLLTSSPEGINFTFLIRFTSALTSTQPVS